MDSFIYPRATQALGAGGFNFDTDAFKIMLLSSVYVPDFDNDEFVADITGEITGTGYTAGGRTVENTTWGPFSTVDWGTPLTASSPVWTDATFTARFAVLYKALPDATTPDPALSRLLGHWDFEEDISVAAAPFTLNITTEGLLWIWV